MSQSPKLFVELDIKKAEVGLDSLVVRSMLAALTEDLESIPNACRIGAYHYLDSSSRESESLTPPHRHACMQH